MATAYGVRVAWRRFGSHLRVQQTPGQETWRRGRTCRSPRRGLTRRCARNSSGWST